MNSSIPLCVKILAGNNIIFSFIIIFIFFYKAPEPLRIDIHFLFKLKFFLNIDNQIYLTIMYFYLKKLFLLII